MQTIRLENLDIYSIRIVLRYYLFTTITIIIIRKKLLILLQTEVSQQSGLKIVKMAAVNFLASKIKK